MSYKISDVVSPYRVSNWCQYPGRWIEEREGPAERAGYAEKVDRLYRSFWKTKLPDAVKIMAQLIETRHVSSLHLPMSINALFLIYVNEQIDLYQNQKEERSFEIDQKWHEFQLSFAKERYKSFTEDAKWGSQFFAELRTLLIEADVLANDFDKTIPLWLGIIKITDMGDMFVAALYEPKAVCKVERGFAHQKQDCVYAELPRSNLEASFYLILRQFSRDYPWVCSKVAQKMQFIEGLQLKEVFRVLALRPLSETSTASSLLLNEFKEISYSLQFLDLTDNNAIEKIQGKLVIICESLKKNFGNFSSDIERLQIDKKEGKEHRIVGNRLNQITNVPEGCSSLVLPMMEGYQECHLLTDCYLAASCIGLWRILEALEKSNVIINESKASGKCPKLIINCPSLLPISQYNAKVADELFSSPSSKQIRIKKTKGSVQPKKVEPKPQTKQVVKKVPQGNVQPQKISLPVEGIKLDPLEELCQKLFNVHHATGSIPLRQALWHMDALITIEHSSNLEQMNPLLLLNVTMSCAHKVLEQVSIFCLESKGITFRSHNLKEHHLKLGTLPYPDIVKQLYLANHWTRYFYVEKERWLSLTTQVVSTPALIDDLVSLAEGKSLVTNGLKNQVLEIIEKTRLHVEKIFSKTSASSGDVSLAKEIAIEVKNPIPLDVFNGVKESLETFLVKTAYPSHHPVCMYVKQAISAISMLKGFLQKIKDSKNSREFATWTSLCVQQIQEGMEDVLHAIEFFKKGEASSLHELKVLSKNLGLEMGELGDACSELSFKPRYPAENLSEGLGAQIIDAVEALRQCPECQDGFELQGPSPKILWKALDKTVSISSVMEMLTTLIQSSEAFLMKEAVPALYNSHTICNQKK